MVYTLLIEAVDSALKFTTRGDNDYTWSADSGFDSEYYHDGDSARSDPNLENGESVLQAVVESDSSEKIKFWWKVSGTSDTDYLKFYIDGTLQQNGSITGETDWAEKEYTVSSGIHTLKWVYEDGGGSSGDNCGWVDFVQWSGYSPMPADSDNWQQLDYKYDVYGRRSEKLVDGYGTRYLYDGDQVIAEYDGNNNLLRKFIYGPGIDQPVSMIEVADSNATYYYHYDALGSVIALSDSSGDTVQTYEYSVFGEVAVEDANHTNPYMFAGRRYDAEIGLYYNRARYYNPYTGRFLQADPIGYGDGMNMYAYCRNNPVRLADPSGLGPTLDYNAIAGDMNGVVFLDSNDSNDSSVPSGGGIADPFQESLNEYRENGGTFCGMCHSDANVAHMVRDVLAGGDSNGCGWGIVVTPFAVQWYLGGGVDLVWLPGKGWEVYLYGQLEYTSGPSWTRGVGILIGIDDFNDYERTFENVTAMVPVPVAPVLGIGVDVSWDPDDGAPVAIEIVGGFGPGASAGAQWYYRIGLNEND